MPRPTKRAKAGRINHYKKYTKNSQTDWTCPNSFEAVAIKKNVSILREVIVIQRRPIIRQNHRDHHDKKILKKLEIDRSPNNIREN